MKYSVVVQGKQRPLEPRPNEEVYRIAKEAIQNAFMHSGGSRIEIECVYGDCDFTLRVRDDGRGIDPEVQAAGGRVGHFGLTGMRERAKRIGANLKVWSQQNAGTEIEVSLQSALLKPSSNRYLGWLSQLRDKQFHCCDKLNHL